MITIKYKEDKKQPERTVSQLNPGEAFVTLSDYQEYLAGADSDTDDEEAFTMSDVILYIRLGDKGVMRHSGSAMYVLEVASGTLVTVDKNQKVIQCILDVQATPLVS